MIEDRNAVEQFASEYQSFDDDTKETLERLAKQIVECSFCCSSKQFVGTKLYRQHGMSKRQVKTLFLYLAWESVRENLTPCVQGRRLVETLQSSLTSVN